MDRQLYDLCIEVCELKQSIEAYENLINGATSPLKGSKHVYQNYLDLDREELKKIEEKMIKRYNVVLQT